MKVEKPRPPHTITDLKMFQDVVALFGQTMNAEHETKFIAQFLYEEVVELIEAIREGYDPCDIASEAADIIMFVTELYNVMELPLELAFKKLGVENEISSIDDLQKAVGVFVSQYPYLDVNDLLESVLQTSENVLRISTNGNNYHALASRAGDAVIGAMQVFNILGISASDMLSRKLNRNQHKYNPHKVRQARAYGVSLKTIRAYYKKKWPKDNDRSFLCD